jgi:predicted molibdopterin-dependent oxidoreductase YjgC
VIEITVDGRNIEVEEGAMLAAVLLNQGIVEFRPSVSGEARQPLCGMGICFECRVTIDGESHRRSCLVSVREGMDVITGE